MTEYLIVYTDGSVDSVMAVYYEIEGQEYVFYGDFDYVITRIPVVWVSKITDE